MTTPLRDPVERIIADALTRAAIEYVVPDRGLDFYLPAFGIHVECKQFFSPRIARQLALNPNTIVIQGIDAAKAFAAMVNRDRRDG